MVVVFENKFVVPKLILQTVCLLVYQCVQLEKLNN